MELPERTKNWTDHLSVKRVRSRPVGGLACRFRYLGSDTGRLARAIEAAMGIRLASHYDPQSGAAWFLRAGGAGGSLISDGDWIVVDAFGRAALVPDKDFATYYEPEEGRG